MFLGVLGVVGLLTFGLVSKGQARLDVGDAVPTDSLQVLGSNETGSVADHRGKWVLVNVWASWCAPCKQEAPDLEAFYRRHGGDNFEIVAVDTQDAAEDAQRFVHEFGLSYPQLRDGDGSYAKDGLKTTGVPESFLVNPDGKLALQIPGQVTESILSQQIAPMIQGS